MDEQTKALAGARSSDAPVASHASLAFTTPGPWQAEMPHRNDVHMGRITTAWRQGECHLVVAQCGLDHVYVGLPGEERIANAYLIAAAPDLYEACQCVLELDDVSDILAGNETLRDLIEAALAKACGEGQ